MDEKTTGREPKITRETYKNIKNFNRQQITDFCMDIYSRGYMDGRNSAPGVDLETILKEIAGTRDIGPKRYAAIKSRLDAIFQKTEKENTDK